jgi:hypothetical protein
VGVLRFLGIALALAVVVVAATAVLARTGDGPIGPFPGGPLEAGTWVDEPVANWSFVAGRREAEIQLLEPPRSRTTWLLVYKGALYIPCGFPNLRWLKQWPHEAVVDGRARLRIDGHLYPVNLVRVRDPQIFDAVGRRVAEKYGVGESETPDQETLWIFRLDPRKRTTG